METAVIPSRAVRTRPLGLIAATSLGLAGLSCSRRRRLPTMPGRGSSGAARSPPGRSTRRPAPPGSRCPSWSTALAPFGAAPEVWLAARARGGGRGRAPRRLLAWRLSGGSLVAGAIASGSSCSSSASSAAGRSASRRACWSRSQRRPAPPSRGAATGAPARPLAALLRPEVWPFLIAYGVVLWRRRRVADAPVRARRSCRCSGSCPSSGARASCCARANAPGSPTPASPRSRRCPRSR